MVQQLRVDLGLFIIETLLLHSDTPQSVGLLWTSDQLYAETSVWQHTTLTRDILALAGFEPAIPASDRPQTHALDGAEAEDTVHNWDRMFCVRCELGLQKQLSIEHIILPNTNRRHNSNF